MKRNVHLFYRSLIVILLSLSICISFGQEEENQKKQKKATKKEKQEQSEEQQNEEEEECEVLLPSITGQYEGGCKNGLAHGKGKAIGLDVYEGGFRKGYPNGQGVFQYSNGDLYTGQFKRGLRDGEGSLITNIENRDTTLVGIWVDDFFVGAKPRHPRATYKYGVDSYSFRREKDGDRFLVEIMLNGMANADLENFTIVSTSGTQFQMGRWIGFEGVTFPVVCKLSYLTWNKIRSAKHEVIFEFELPEEGDWKIRIIN